MRIRFLLAIVCCTLCILVAEPYPLFAQPGTKVSVECQEFGLRLHLRHVSESLIRELHKQAKLSNSQSSSNSSSIQNSMTNLSLRYQVVVPRDGDIFASIENLKLTTVAGKSIFSGVRTPSVNIRRAGVSRGESIALLEINTVQGGVLYENDAVVDDVDIRVTFSKPVIRVSKLNTAKSSINFYDRLNSEFSSQDPTMQNAASLPVVKLRTVILDSTKSPLRVVATKDGVAMLRLSQILKLKPEWNAQKSTALHLTLRGREQRLFIPKDDGFLSENDTVYFVAQHATGDTTWWSPFSWETVYYLDVDDSFQGPRYSTRALLNTVPVVDAIDVNMHVEYENDYNQSYANDDPFHSYFVTDNVGGEKWYWASFDRNNPFDYSLPLVSTKNEQDSVHVTIAYTSVNDIERLSPDKRVQALLNGKQVYDETFDGTHEKVIRSSLTSMEASGGNLNVRVNSLGTFVDSLNYSELQILDYIELSGRVASYATMGKLEGGVRVTQPSNLDVQQLSSASSVMLDTINAEAVRVIGRPSSSVVCRSSKNKSLYWTSIEINGHAALTRSGEGLSICVAVAPAYTSMNKWKGSSGDKDAVSFLQDQTENSVIAICANDNREFSTELKAFLQAQNCPKSFNRVTGACYSAAFIKNANKQIFEDLNSESSLLMATIFHPEGRVYAAVVPLRDGQNSVNLNSQDSIEDCSFQSVIKSDLHSANNAADYVIITHRDFEKPARRLATYRAAQGQRCSVVFVDDIYREFNQGQKSPHALRAFLKYAYESWQRPAVKNVLMFGDASWDGRQIPPLGIKKDFVPTFGKPVSDIWFTLVDGLDSLPDFNIGRIPAETEYQANTFVTKLIEYDTCKPDLWWKTFLFVSGGIGAFEQQDFLDVGTYALLPFIISDDIDFRKRSICGDTAFVSTMFADTWPSYSPLAAIEKTVNGQGAFWVNYIGHGAPNITEIGGWDTTTLANQGKPFVLSTLACQNAAFAEREVTSFDENFMMVERRGAIAAIGSTGYAVPLVQYNVMDAMFRLISQSKLRTLGDIFTTADSYLGLNKDAIVKGVFLQCCLLGDPLTRVPFDTVAHPVILPASVKIRDEESNQFITEDRDSAIVSFVIFNAGMHPDVDVPIVVIHSFDGHSDTLHMMLSDLCFTNALRFSIGVKQQVGEHSLVILLDPQNTLRQGNRSDSSFITSFRVYSRRPLPVDPLAGWNVSSTRPRFRVIAPSALSNQFYFETQLRHGQDTLESVLASQNSKLTVDETFVEWQPTKQLTNDERYMFAIRTIDRANQKPSAWLEVPFVACEDSLSSGIYIERDIRHDASTFSQVHMRADTTAEGVRYIMNSSIPYEMSSAVGFGRYDSLNNLVIDIYPTLQIRINGVTYGDRNDLRGFNVRVINRRTGQLRAARTFDCFFDKDSCDSCFNGSGRTINKFLRDSIRDDDYVFLSVCGNTYGPVFAKRDQDSLQAVLRSLGAQFSDSVRSPHSYVFVGARNRAGLEVREKVRLDTLTAHAFEDTVSVSGVIRITPDTAYFSSASYGPAKTWKNLTIQGRLNDSITSKRLRVYGLRSSFSKPELLREDSVVNLSLEFIDSQSYPYIQFDLSLHRKNFVDDPTIESVRIDLEPLGEMAIIPSTVGLVQDSLLRGDSSTLVAQYKRISPRATLDSSNLTMEYVPVKTSGENRTRVFSTASPVNDEVIGCVDLTSTLEFATNNSCVVTIDRDNRFPELYRFNNSLVVGQHTRDDDESPELKLFVDGVEAENGMFVSKQPSMFTYFTDNSQLSIHDSWHLELVVNTRDVDSTSQGYRFYPSSKVMTLPGLPVLTRAALQAQPQLEFGTNNIKVVATDYFGNEQVKRFVFSVSRDLYAGKSKVFPNPFSETANILYVLKSPMQDEAVRFVVYDLRGEMLRSMQQSARIGLNTIVFDGRDDNGRELAQGTYYYRIFVQENGSIDSDHGLLSIVR